MRDSGEAHVLLEPMTPAGYQDLARELEAAPWKTLRAGGDNRELASLQWLRWFPNLRRLSLITLHHVEDLSALGHLPADLESLDLGATRRALDLAPALRFEHLRELRVEGHRRRLAEVVERNKDLRVLSLWRLPSVDAAVPQLPPFLQALSVTLGSIKNATWMTQCEHLRFLAIRATRGITDLGVISQLERLQWLWLESMGGVERLPDLSGHESLLRIELSSMRGLRGEDALVNVARAPHLRELHVTESRLPANAFAPLVDHPHLERLAIGLGSDRRNREVEEWLALPKPYTHDEFSRAYDIPFTV